MTIRMPALGVRASFIATVAAVLATAILSTRAASAADAPATPRLDRCGCGASDDHHRRQSPGQPLLRRRRRGADLGPVRGRRRAGPRWAGALGEARPVAEGRAREADARDRAPGVGVRQRVPKRL